LPYHAIWIFWKNSEEFSQTACAFLEDVYFTRASETEGGSEAKGSAAKESVSERLKEKMKKLLTGLGKWLR
jgi:hypothetical protein